jgi:hypothetical protein
MSRSDAPGVRVPVDASVFRLHLLATRPARFEAMDQVLEAVRSGMGTVETSEPLDAAIRLSEAWRTMIERRGGGPATGAAIVVSTATQASELRLTGHDALTAFAHAHGMRERPLGLLILVEQMKVERPILQALITCRPETRIVMLDRPQASRDGSNPDDAPATMGEPSIEVATTATP